MMGSYLVRRLSGDSEVCAAAHADLDVGDQDAVERAIDRFRPQVVFNCAAISGVDQCERDPDLAFRVNATGPLNLARACRRIGAQLVHVSTDYVFDGTKATPYTIDDEPNPVNRYGSSKLAGEQAVRETVELFYIIRPARIFGLGGRNFASTILKQIKEQGRVRAITEEIGSPTYARDLAERILKILSLGQPGIYHVTNNGGCSWYEFTSEVLHLLGREDVIVEEVHGADLRRPARRPPYTVMRCLLSERLGLEPLRDWRQAFIDFVREVGER